MRSPQSFPGTAIVPNIVLLASEARTTTGTGDAVAIDGGFDAMVVVLDVTAAASTVADTLDVYLQTTIDGTTWLDAIHFTQVVGNGGAKRYVSKLSASLALTEYETGTALGAAAVRHLIGDQWRVRWAITDDSTEASFTFSVRANQQ